MLCNLLLNNLGKYIISSVPTIVINEISQWYVIRATREKTIPDTL